MGCLYAIGPIDKCLCSCDGDKHGLLSGKITLPAKCSPAAEIRCKSGQEGGECHCACGGQNHAIYAGIENYKITMFENV